MRSNVATIARREDLPPSFDVDADQTVPNRVYSAWIPAAGPRPLRRELSHYERVTVERRVEALRRAVQPWGGADSDRCAAAIGAMFGKFRSLGRQQGENVVATVQGMLSTLRDLPPWAIIEGCALIGDGRAGLKLEYPPNNGEVRDVCMRLVSPYARRLLAAEALLKAPIDEEPRAKPLPAPDIDPLAARLGQGKDR